MVVEALTLQHFEAYASGLGRLLNNAGLVAEVLELWLDCFYSPCFGNGHEKSSALDEEYLLSQLVGGGSETLASVLLLRRILQQGSGCSASLQKKLLEALPGILEVAPSAVHMLIAETAALCVPESEAAGRWILERLDEGNFETCACVIPALLERHKAGPVSEAVWVVAERGLHDASQRRLCSQVLLPAIVACEGEEATVPRISKMLGTLFDNASGATEKSDALNLAVALRAPLLRHWRLASLKCSEANDLGWRFIHYGLRRGRKQACADGKSARCLLEAAVCVALEDPGAESCIAKGGSTIRDVQTAWKGYWELFDTMEDYSSHLIKAGWSSAIIKVTDVLRATSGIFAEGRWPLVFMAPPWLETLFVHALDHDNDTTQKFVVAKLVALDQSFARLTESFVINEMLPRLSQNIDSFYHHTDVEQVFEKQVLRFFSDFLIGHPEGTSAAVPRLLAACTSKSLHHTPLRLVLASLLESDVPRSTVDPQVILSEARAFLETRLLRQPLSVRPTVAALVMRVVAHHCCPPSSESLGCSIVFSATGVAAAIPHALLSKLRSHLAETICAALGDAASAATQCASLLRGLLSDSPGNEGPTPGGIEHADWEARRADPMTAVKLTLGIVRLLWALQSISESTGSSASSCNGSTSAFLSGAWDLLMQALRVVFQRPYLPRRFVVASLFGATYSMALMPICGKAQEKNVHARDEALAYVTSRAAACFAEGCDDILAEAPWIWLFSFVLSRFWVPGAPHGEEIAAHCEAALAKAKVGSNKAPQEAEKKVLRGTLAAALLAALAPRMACPKRRANLFLTLWCTEIQKPRGVDAHFGVGGQEDWKESWPRPRLEEHDDLHRIDHEGLPRILEWRDIPSSFLISKWQALAALAQAEDFLPALRIASQPLELQASKSSAWPQNLAAALLEELDTMSHPHIGLWSIVVRRVAYPIFFSAGAAPVEDQREALRVLCRDICGTIADGCGDSSITMPRACLAELCSGLCDSQLLLAEGRLFAGSVDCDDEADEDVVSGEGPVTAAISKLLAVGESAVGVSRGVAVPLLTALASIDHRASEHAMVLLEDRVGEILAMLLTHREATIGDGAFCRAPDVEAAKVDNPGGAGDVSARFQAAQARFTPTPGLSRVLCLVTLDKLNDPSKSSKLILKTCCKLLATLKELLRELLEGKPDGVGDEESASKKKKAKAKAKPQNQKPKSEIRPPTPMPWSATHRIQLRGWQALFVLGVRAEAEVGHVLIRELFQHIRTPHVPDVRDYQELLGCVLCAKFQDWAVEELLVPALQEVNTNVQVSASLLIIACYLFREWAKGGARSAHDNKAPFNPPVRPDPHRIGLLIRAVVPYMTHNSAFARGMAQWGLFTMLDGLEQFGGFQVVLPKEAQVLMPVHAMLSTHPECIKMRRRQAPLFTNYDPFGKDALALLVDRSLLVPAPPDLPESSTSAFSEAAAVVFADGDFRPQQTFLNLLKEEVSHEMEIMWDRSDTTLYPSSSGEWRSQLERALLPLEPDILAEFPASCNTASAAAEGVSGIQRKFMPTVGAEAPEGEAISRSSASSLSRRVREPLVVIASLVDKTPNLAGLTRTCEVLNCEALTMANTNIIKDTSFQSISVTAEKWLPIVEVPKKDLAKYLEKYRQRGYALVGVEQTHNSVKLGEFQFPEQVVLVLGAEKEGIDAELLPLLDVCVEIPQAGQIRSLNVHVSGSVVMWEITKQRLAAKRG